MAVEPPVHALGAPLAELRVTSDAEHRSVPERQIVEALCLLGSPSAPESDDAMRVSAAALQDFVDMGLAYRRDALERRCFDPVEVNAAVRITGLRFGHEFYRRHYIPRMHEAITAMAPTSLDAETPERARRFTVELRRTFNLSRLSPDTTTVRLRAPLPLAGSHVTDIEVEPYTDAARDAVVVVRPGHVEMRARLEGRSDVTVGAHVRCTVRTQEPRDERDSTPPDPAFLADRESVIAVTDRVRTLARSLAPQEADAMDVMRAYWEHIHGNWMIGSVHYHRIDAASPTEWLLENGWLDCQCGAAVFVALCRARGIPARIAGGFWPHPAYPGFHYWAEAWTARGGWAPYDFGGWDLSFGGEDLAWRDRFFRRLDYRLPLQRMPREFTGPAGVPLPSKWCVLPTARNGAGGVAVCELDGTPVYTDMMRIVDDGS